MLGHFSRVEGHPAKCYPALADLDKTTPHTRNLKDAQRMYNYMSSANVEFIALQTKTPFIAPAEAIEGYE
ncbi:portal protein, partial [Ralstonia mannitolilytica]